MLVPNLLLTPDVLNVRKLDSQFDFTGMIEFRAANYLDMLTHNWAPQGLYPKKQGTQKC